MDDYTLDFPNKLRNTLLNRTSEGCEIGCETRCLKGLLSQVSLRGVVVVRVSGASGGSELASGPETLEPPDALRDAPVRARAEFRFADQVRAAITYDRYS